MTDLYWQRGCTTFTYSKWDTELIKWRMLSCCLYLDWCSLSLSLCRCWLTWRPPSPSPAVRWPATSDCPGSPALTRVSTPANLGVRKGKQRIAKYSTKGFKVKLVETMFRKNCLLFGENYSLPVLASNTPFLTLSKYLKNPKLCSGVQVWWRARALRTRSIWPSYRHLWWRRGNHDNCLSIISLSCHFHLQSGEMLLQDKHYWEPTRDIKSECK